MPLTPTNYSATCDVPDCTQQALGTLQHLSTKGWNLKVLYLGEVALFSAVSLLDMVASHLPRMLSIGEVQVMGDYGGRRLKSNL
jgi:hypothetical protein